LSPAVSSPDGAAADVLVYGAGSIGLWIGGKLAAAGSRVHFVGRAGIVDALEHDGLRLIDLNGAVTVVPGERISASTGLHDAPPARLVLLTVKGTGTEAAAAELAASHLADVPLISFQNGVQNLARIRRVAPDLPALAGMVPYNVIQPEPGSVRQASDGQLACADNPVSRAWQDSFIRAGIALQLHADMPAVQWGKLLLNLNNPINALIGLPLREQLLARGARRVLAALQSEALDLLHAAGIRPARVTPLPATWLPGFLRLPTWVFAPLARRMLRISPDARSSMYDDRKAGKPTEIDDLCGAVVALGSSLGRDAPRNRRLAELIRSVPTGEYLSVAQLEHALLG
jgi:2-dehydropantoate 2-reductase